MANKNLTSAKKAKNDEFYTQYFDIEKEVAAYIEYNPDVFRDKTILLPCDDPEWSNFTKFFAQNFDRYGLKKLISTSYAEDSKKYKSGYKATLFETSNPQFDNKKTTKHGKLFILTKDKNKDGKIDYEDLEWEYLKEDGDFRSEEVMKLRDEADIIITNPPFSLFREFLAWITEAKKKFLIIGNMNAITYKEVFPLIKGNNIWLGVNNGAKIYRAPDHYEQENIFTGKDGKKYAKMGNTGWYTNIDHGRRHQPLQLMTEKEIIKYVTKKPFIKYDNYNAIEVSAVKNIPSDYKGMMGVPISFLDRYNPKQFEILGTSDNGLVDKKFKRTPGLTSKFVNDYYKGGGTGSYKEGNPTAGYYDNDIAKMAYKRLFIKHKKQNENNIKN